MKSLISLRFVPVSSDVALLALRIWFGLALAVNHGWPKLMTFSEKAAAFSDPLGIGHAPSMIGTILGELVCSSLLVLGLFTRLAAIGAGFTMAVAFIAVHHAKLTGQGNGELAFIYLGAHVVLFLAGAGRYSLDRKLAGAG